MANKNQVLDMTPLGMKFTVLQNPSGILFDPNSVCNSLLSYIRKEEVGEKELFQLNDVWHSWKYHSRYSTMTPGLTIEQINSSVRVAHDFLKDADWLIITLGSSFSYRLTEEATKAGLTTGAGVANCHRAPAQWFNKHLLNIDEIVSMLENCYKQLLDFNPKLKLLFTISPVRHLRDGVIENNRSKARLIESVHHLVNKHEGVYYFPAYELVVDVLRDYRFYDIDLAHPNYMATNFVMEKFIDSCIDTHAQKLMEEIKKIVIARKHKAFQPTTPAHQQFLQSHAHKVKDLMAAHPFLDLNEELNYFSSSI